MKITTTLALAVAALTVNAPARAADSAITAVGHSRQPLTIAGPDQLGRYTLRVNLADLDVGSSSGWATMNHRVAMGTSLLCDTAAPQPYGGYYYRERRDCGAESDAIASAQMIRARDLARAGKAVAYLQLER